MSESTVQPSPVPRDTDQLPGKSDSDAEVRIDDEREEVPAPAEQGQEETARASSRTRRFVRLLGRRRVLLPLLLICVLLAGVALLGIAWYRDNALHEARSSAVASAREYAVALTTYDYQTLRGDFTKVSSNATGAFAKEYKQVSSNLTKLIKRNKAVSEGNVTAAGLVSGNTDRAVVLLFVDQTITNSKISKPRIDRNRMRMTLLRENERWLIDNVELL